MKSCAVCDCSDACELLSDRWMPLVVGAGGGSMVSKVKSKIRLCTRCNCARAVRKVKRGGDESRKAGVWMDSKLKRAGPKTVSPRSCISGSRVRFTLKHELQEKRVARGCEFCPSFKCSSIQPKPEYNFNEVCISEKPSTQDETNHSDQVHHFGQICLPQTEDAPRRVGGSVVETLKTMLSLRLQLHHRVVCPVVSLL